MGRKRKSALRELAPGVLEMPVEHPTVVPRPVAEPEPELEQEQEPGRKPRARSRELEQGIRARRRTEFCFRCGTPFPQDMVQCPACGGMVPGLAGVIPILEVQDDYHVFDKPWDLLTWPRGGSAALFGGPGSGKSTLASMIKPTNWITKEQDPKPVGAMFRRTCPGHMPLVKAVQTAEEVAEFLETVVDGPIVVDSLTAFGLRDALIVAHLLVNWARDHDERALAILQLNKEGEAAGYNEIPHLFDAIVEAAPDLWGVRAFNVRKSRWSPLGAQYWTFDGAGTVSIPAFDAAYSVEGTPGNYWLHPFPMKGAKWADMLEVLSGSGLLLPGVACSGLAASYMPQGFVIPQDDAERRRFAEAHGLRWVTPEEIREQLEAHEADRKARERTEREAAGRRSLSGEGKPKRPPRSRRQR